MVVAHIKKGDDSLFLLDAKTSDIVGDVCTTVTAIHNGRIAVHHICSELESLCEYGVSLPPNMVGLLEEQIAELKVSDEWGEVNHPSGGFTLNKDPCGKRNGQQPTPAMRAVLTKTIGEVRGRLAKQLVDSKQSLTEQHVADCFSMLRGAVTIVYPMGLPEYEPISQYLQGHDLENIPQIIEPSKAQLWFAGKALSPDEKLAHYIGNNEKTKFILKLVKVGDGAPSREPQLDAPGQAKIMAQLHRRQEELRRLGQDRDDSYLDSPWADPGHLQREFHGLQNIHWKPH